MFKIINLLFAFCLVLTMPATAQNPKTNVNTIRELAIVVQLGFENAEKQRQADREAAEKQRQADREAAEKQRQADREAIDKRFDALEKRIDLLENLIFGIFGVLVSIGGGLVGYLIWTQKRERELAQGIGTMISLQDFQQLMQRVQAIEKQIIEKQIV